MSKKLLEESTIRSFMKLANLQPLTAKFLKEAAEEEDKSRKQEGVVEEEVVEEEVVEEEVVEEDGDSLEEAHVIFGKDEDAKSRDVPADRQNPTSGAGGGHKKAPKKTKVAKPGKMDAAKNAPGDAELKPVKQTHIHSDKPDSVEAAGHSNAKDRVGGKSRGEFEMVTESLEEEMEEAEVEAPEMGSAGESSEHQDKMKELIRGMLNSLKDMGAEYGMSMEISDEGAAAPEGGEEMEAPAEAPPAGAEDQEEDEGIMQEKLDEMVEKLTKRVAARLVKESKKKR